MSDRTIITVRVNDEQREYFKYLNDHDKCMQSIDDAWDLLNDRVVINKRQVPAMLDFLRTMSVLRGGYFDPVKAFINELEEEFERVG